MFLVGVAGVAGAIWHFSKDLPDYSQLAGLRAAGDDARACVRRRAARRILQGAAALSADQAVPKLVINAFLAAEDKNFYEHGGIDFTGMARAAVHVCAELRLQPPSAGRVDHHPAGREELPSDQRGLVRRARSRKRLLAMRIERAYSKDRILELYLNEIYLGLGAYGIAAASLVYFDKSVNELTIAEASYLAALPKAPAGAAPGCATATARSSGATTWSIACWKTAGSSRPTPTRRARNRSTSPAAATARISSPARYFAEEVRRDIFERYGERSSMKAGCRFAPRSIRRLQVDGAQGHGRRSRQI